MTNSIVIVGRLTKDPDARSTSSGVNVTMFTVAVDRGYTTKNGEKETDFIPVVTWRGLADNCSKFLTKGKLVSVTGRLQIRNYEDKKGDRRTIAEIVADNVDFLSPKDTEQSSGGRYQEQYQESEPIDDIPF